MRSKTAKIILEAKRKSLAECERILQADPLTLDFLHDGLRKYTMYRYLITDEDCSSDNLKELATVSIEKGANISREIAQADETSGGCVGASSVDSKLVLLIFAIQKEFQITLPADKAVRTETLTDLAALMLPCLNSK